MRKTLYAASICALLAFDGCSALTTPVSPADVYALENTLVGVDKLALIYTSSSAANPQIKAQIKADAQKAHDAFKALQVSAASGAPAALTLAQTAISAFAADIPITTK